MRLLVGALVVCLAVVPAAVRATRVVDASGRPTLAPSFKKSFDEPPHAADIRGEIQVTVLAVVECGPVAPGAAVAPSRSLRTPDTLRGPPVAARS